MINQLERQELMTIGLNYVPNHCKVAAQVIDDMGKELHKNKWGYLDDPSWAYHIIVPDGKGNWYSLFCGGFTHDIDVHLLNLDRSPNTEYEEQRFATPKEVFEYLKTVCVNKA